MSITSASSELSFRIDGMCCAEEINALKRTVGPVVGGEEQLSFNLLSGKMTVAAGNAAASEIEQAVRRAGLAASPWTDEPAPESRWQRHGATTLCALSGLSTAAGLWLHALSAGSLLTALAAEQVPATAATAYLLAIVTGIGFVVPKAWTALRSLRPDMNLLMTIAVVGALLIGEWLEAASVAFLFALALRLETWSVGRARHAIEALLELKPETARVRDPESGEVLEQGVDEVPVGSIVLVRPAERVPLDGTVIGGESAIDQSPITGESVPVAKGEGDDVFAGTVNGEGAIELRSTRVASQSTLAHIVRLVEEAGAKRAPSERWVDRFARRYTPAVMALALVLALTPPLLLGQPWQTWIYNALVLLVIACPCALVISTPVSIVAGLASAARAGVLIKGGAFLEAPAEWKAVAFDKTGTLTVGEPRVHAVLPRVGQSERELLGHAAALEAESTHPLARAINEAAVQHRAPLGLATELKVYPGRGAEGVIDGRTFWIGSHRFMVEREVDSAELRELADELEQSGHSVVAVGCEDEVCGLLGIADELRAEAPDALARLRSEGVEVLVMLTGDNRRTAERIAQIAGLGDYRAELLPEDKVEAVALLGSQHGSVAMVGDGINDAPALAASSCGIAMGAAGTDVAIETADIALMADDLSRLPWLVRHSKRTLQIVRANIAFALAIKAIFVALALIGVATLWMAIAADMGASLLVIGNGLRLLRSYDR